MQSAQVAAAGVMGLVQESGGRAYIFGYGSLINNESRCGSNGMKANQAALVHIKASFGFSRAFCARSRTGFTALGLRPDLDGSGEGICGVIYPVNPVSLSEYDLREKDYNRVIIAHEHIELRKLGQDFEWCLQDSDRIYTYVPKQECVFPACEDFPIIQTYVDTCLQGCKQWGGVELMKVWVATTAMWSKHWLNDCPLSRRPWLHRPDYVDIDEVLSSFGEHTLFKHRRHAEEYVHSSNRERGSSVALAAGLGGTPNKAPQVISLAGIWGCPSRNPLFVGRDSALDSLASLLKADGFAEVTGLGGIGKSSLVSEFCHRHFSGTGFSVGSGTASSSAAEGTYGLVVYLRAESRASIAADIRKFAFDLRVLDPRILSTSKTPSGADEQDSGAGAGAGLELDDDTVIEEFKRRLAVQQSRCLLVFDNLECPGDPGGSSRSAVAPYLPRGKLGYEGAFASAASGGKGAAISSENSSGTHVLVTRRIAASGFATAAAGSEGPSAGLALDSLRPAESLQYLSRSLLCDADSATATVAEQGEEDREAAELQALAERLGHLPLALAQAVAFIKRVDISAKEYIERLDLCDSGARADGDVLDSVYASLSMAVQRIECESPAAVSVLMRLGWLSPENITKRLVQTLLETMQSKHPLAPKALLEEAPTFLSQCDASAFRSRAVFWSAAGLGIFGVSACLYGALFGKRVGKEGTASTRDALGLCAAALGGGYCAWAMNWSDDLLQKSLVSPLQTSISNAVAMPALGEPMLEADRVWEILKQYNILTVRGTRRSRVASIHRMQQSYLRRRSLSQVGTATLCIEQCIWALSDMWGTRRRRAGEAGDGTSGSSGGAAADLLDHILVMAGHVAVELDRRGVGLVDLRDESPKKTSVMQSPWGMRDAHVSRLAFLLTDVAAHVTQALSRFDMADTLLTVALRLQEAMRNSSTQETNGARQLLGDTFHLAGTIGRLRGNFTLARERLTIALRLRNTPVNKGQYWSVTGEEFCGDLRSADTMHEMGILELRQGGLSAAHALLSKSLAIKTSAPDYISAPRARPPVAMIKTQSKSHNKASEGEEQAEEQIGLTTVSATLHQLAVVATLRKEYDEAERLLKQALVLDGVDGPTKANPGARSASERGMLSKVGLEGNAGATAAYRRLVSIAAATQQLGRISFRRGHLTQARAYFIQSLDTYSQAYGAVMHINVAAVYHQLGTTYHAMRDFDEAFSNYQRALDIRLAAFTPDHMDVLRTYAEMAQCELDRGRGREAEELWQGLQARLEVAVAQAQQHGLHPVSGSEAGGDEASERDRRNARLSTLLRYLLRALYARRLYYRRRAGVGATAQDAEMVVKLTAAIGEAKQLEGLLQQPGSLTASVTLQQDDHGQVSTSVRKAVLDARALVRQEALSVIRACSAASTESSSSQRFEEEGHLTRLLALYDSLATLPEKLERLLSSMLAYSDEDDGLEGPVPMGASALSYETHAASSSFSEAGPLVGDVALSRAAKSFLADVRALVHSLHRVSSSSTEAALIAQGLFNACDRLRSEVQVLGTTVED
jgi:tetratricopeptide (TPR) repeat protein